jgi:ribosomal protein S30
LWWRGQIQALAIRRRNRPLDVPRLRPVGEYDKRILAVMERALSAGAGNAAEE